MDNLNLTNEYFANLFRTQNERDAIEGDIITDGGKTYSFWGGVWNEIDTSQTGIPIGMVTPPKNLTKTETSSPATPEVPTQSAEGEKKYGAFGDINLQKYLVESGLQNIFNLYEKNIAGLNTQQKKQLEEQAYIREMSKKYLGEYGASSGASTMSTEAGLVDIYSKYMENKAAIDTNYDALKLSLEQEYQTQKTGLEAQEKSLETQYEDAVRFENAQKAAVEIANKTYGGYATREEYIESLGDSVDPQDILTILGETATSSDANEIKVDAMGGLYYSQYFDLYSGGNGSGIFGDKYGDSTFVTKNGQLMVQQGNALKETTYKNNGKVKKENDGPLIKELEQAYQDEYGDRVFRNNSVVQSSRGEFYVYNNGKWYALKATNLNAKEFDSYDVTKLKEGEEVKTFKVTGNIVDKGKNDYGWDTVKIAGVTFKFGSTGGATYGAIEGNETYRAVRDVLAKKYGNVSKIPNKTVIVYQGNVYIYYNDGKMSKGIVSE